MGTQIPLAKAFLMSTHNIYLILWRNVENDKYRNDPKFSDRQAWANSVDPDQTAPLIRVYTVCHSVCIVWTHYSMVEPHSSNFRVYYSKLFGCPNI